jgi:hypothetical protein
MCKIKPLKKLRCKPQDSEVFHCGSMGIYADLIRPYQRRAILELLFVPGLNDLSQCTAKAGKCIEFHSINEDWDGIFRVTCTIGYCAIVGVGDVRM